MLEACPLCSHIRDNKVVQHGVYCAVIDLNGVKVVALLRHDSIPVAAEAMEAWNMINIQSGVVKGVEIPGHWAISAHVGEWDVGRSAGHSESPNK